MRHLTVLGIVLAALTFSFRAHADRELIVPFHEGGHLVIDQLSGLRVGASSGLAYAGPVGFSFRSEKADAIVPGAGDAEVKTTTMWLAPSADVFVTDHLSVGGLVEVSHTFGSTTVNGQKLDWPGTTNVTVLPRVGFYVPIGDRFGVWPRAGVGYAAIDSVHFPSAGGAPVRETFQAAVIDFDLALVYRFNETFFMRGGPEVGTSIGGRQSREEGGNSSATGASVLQISGVVGLGLNVEL